MTWSESRPRNRVWSLRRKTCLDWLCKLGARDGAAAHFLLNHVGWGVLAAPFFYVRRRGLQPHTTKLQGV